MFPFKTENHRVIRLYLCNVVREEGEKLQLLHKKPEHLWRVTGGGGGPGVSDHAADPSEHAGTCAYGQRGASAGEENPPFSPLKVAACQTVSD